MKKTLLLALLFVGNYGFTQGYKQDINVELLTEIISKKQNEIRKVVMQNTLKKASRVTNLATANTTINIANTLLVEKNKVLMNRRILQELTLYSFSYYFKEIILSDMEFKEKVEEKAIEKKNMISKKTDYISNIDFNIKNEKKITKSNDSTSIINHNINSYLFDTLYNYFTSKLNDNLFKKYFPNINEHKSFFTSNDFKHIVSDHKKKEINSQLEKYLKIIDSMLYKTDSLYTELKQLSRFDFRNLQFSDLTAEKLDSLISLVTPVVDKIDKIVSQNNVIKEYYNLILKYIVIDKNQNDKKYYTIDVEAIILELESSIFNNRTYGIDKYYVGFQPFFNIGLNYGWFTSQVNEFNFENSLTSLSSMAWAGEKIGIKIIFADYKYSRSKLPNDWYSYRGSSRKWKYSQNDPFINKFYLNIYGSGLLYNIANLKTEKEFDYAIAGTHLGVEMFNGLDISIGYAIPFINGYDARKTFNNGFINLSFDIPIFEYIREARKD